jgi:Tfp pilus assembly protein PilO
VLRLVMKMTKALAAIVAVVLAAGAAMFVHMQRSIERLRADNAELRQHVSESAGLRNELKRLSHLRVDYDELERFRREAAEVHKLRNEIRLARDEAARGQP